MQRKSHRNFGQRLQKTVKSMDVFGIPVSLTYKNEPHIKSFIGGFATVLMRTGVFIYLLYQCADVLKRKTIIQSSQHRLDLSFLKTEPEVQENLEQYAYVQLSQNQYPWVIENERSIQLKVRNRLETENCKYGRLGLQENSIDYLKIIKTYQCPKKIDFQLQSSYSARLAQQVQIAVFPCNQTYLDITTNNTKKSTHTYSCSARLEISNKNEVKLQDSMFYGEEQQKQYIETRLDYFNVQELTTDGQTSFVSFTLQMGDTVKTVNRQAVTFIDALQNTGGFMSVLFVITLNIKSLYQYQSEHKCTDEITDQSISKEFKTNYDQNQEVTIDKLQNKTFYDTQLLTFDKDNQSFESRISRIVAQFKSRLKLKYSTVLSKGNSFQKWNDENKQRTRYQIYSQRIENYQVYLKEHIMINSEFLRQALIQTRQNAFDRRLMKSIELTIEEQQQLQEVFNSKDLTIIRKKKKKDLRDRSNSRNLKQQFQDQFP
ncbi:UNKNOWN [Stylonychia lemnae]|uniref:Transmembrane protein n=1 Tax=Stylonychia lemnae TaxID=5949 RepID=A0A078AVK5_STYLE|nr:UNKNOWN [Stylonychia lemnae]|eukprot:CDW86101.1 UNKNOWN [Stylonychia lemnae]